MKDRNEELKKCSPSDDGLQRQKEIVIYRDVERVFRKCACLSFRTKIWKSPDFAENVGRYVHIGGRVSHSYCISSDAVYGEFSTCSMLYSFPAAIIC